jgi:ATP-dependent helicase/nuclease subunit A
VTTDQGARASIREELDTTFVVTAGAGTGKTTALVERIVALVRSGRASLGELAAITFTEAAAAELRERVRLALVESCRANPGDKLLETAVHDVDEAAISTLHSFAQRLLTEHCAAAGLPSGFEVLDDTADVFDLEQRWKRFADTLFDDPSAQPALVRGFLTGLRHTDLQSVAEALHRDWDRLEDLDADWAPELQAREAWTPVDPDELIGLLEDVLDMAPWCSEELDNLAVHIRETVADAHRQLSEARGDEEAVLSLLHGLPNLSCQKGRQENWEGRITQAREACAKAEEARTTLLENVHRSVLAVLVPLLACFVLESAEARRCEGRLNFHDLLVFARRLLRDGGEPLRALRNSYRFVLVDEFQDTDPIQAEIAGRLAAATPGSDRLDDLRPGALFVVGDPKQSIYRFRRADIDLFDRVSGEIGRGLVLDTNFRSLDGVLDFVNMVFDSLFGAEPAPGQAAHHDLVGARGAVVAAEDASANGGGLPADTRPSARSTARRKQPGRDQLRLPLGGGLSSDEELDLASEEGDTSKAVTLEASEAAPPVVLLGGPSEGSVPDVRRQSSRDAAVCIRRIVEEGWLVAVDSEVRAARFSDVVVLLPTRTSLSALEEAFDDYEVPYRLEGASMLWTSEEVKDVLFVLRAADDPTDPVAVLAALRSPGLACGDDDLLTWHKSGGSWDPEAPYPENCHEHPVARAMAVLSGLRSARWWNEPSQMVARACKELRSFELAFAHFRPRDRWQRLRWLCDQARMFDETLGGSLRDFLAWAELQADGSGGAAGIGPPDPDDDAVRVMTVHGAKGLEFPVVVLCGLERQDADGRRPKPVLYAADGTLEVRAGPTFKSAGFDSADQREQELEELERARVLYVALTRARDHLVVCLHHKERNGTSDSSLAARLFDLCSSHPELWRELPEGIAPAPRTLRRIARLPLDQDPLDDAKVGDEWKRLRDQWATRRKRVLASSRRRPVVAATALGAQDPGSVTDGDHQVPAASTGRPRDGGTGAEIARGIGLAVHAVLATVDLSSTPDPSDRELEEMCLARARAYGVAERAADVTRMAHCALGSDVVRRGATRRHWRELYVAAPLEPTSAQPPILEGVVDLLYEDDDGLVVVDYKTDRHESSDLGTHAGYGVQVAAYAAALERATAKHVVRCILLFLGGKQADAAPTSVVLEGRALDEARSTATRLVLESLAEPPKAETDELSAVR